MMPTARIAGYGPEGAAQQTAVPRDETAYWISSGLTITQFLSAVTGKPSLA